MKSFSEIIEEKRINKKNQKEQKEKEELRHIEFSARLTEIIDEEIIKFVNDPESITHVISFQYPFNPHDIGKYFVYFDKEKKRKEIESKYPKFNFIYDHEWTSKKDALSEKFKTFTISIKHEGVQNMFIKMPFQNMSFEQKLNHKRMKNYKFYEKEDKKKESEINENKKHLMKIVDDEVNKFMKNSDYSHSFRVGYHDKIKEYFDYFKEMKQEFEIKYPDFNFSFCHDDFDFRSFDQYLTITVK